MFYHRRNHHAHGFLYALSLVGAFYLGKKYEENGYCFMSRGCGCSSDDEDMDMMNDDSTPNSFPR
ncbi:hypothetical protein [Desulfosporosinus sp. Sb-LF]|uniref:hypothetical protein n=1 Tax=Desulfosporosinus sp. Sb-LF TaxID=2560027 RepID=UPI00107F9D19|nr:hypothetical protein [Desulfosporosinus sp. Sb-LF]TGE34318.1 hypothetical protein E4K68_01035 [Desulfosporosinus sp. Sb-LF]